MVGKLKGWLGQLATQERFKYWASSVSMHPGVGNKSIQRELKLCGKQHAVVKCLSH